MYQNFIGIDIGKKSFYSFVYGAKKHHIYSNDQQGFAQFFSDHKNTLTNCLVVLETTGGYEIALIDFLMKHSCIVHRANTTKVKHFIRSYGRLGKSDSIDAEGLAQYAFERHLALEPYTQPERKQLLKLVQRRQDLKKMLAQEKNRLSAPDICGLENSYQVIIDALKQEICKINNDIDAIFAANPELKTLKNVMISVPGIGEVTATDLIALLPELGSVNRRKIASLAGVAPHPNESGEKIGYRFIRGGRTEVKPVLFMAAMAACRSNSELGEFYRRLVEAGKKKMVAIAALMRKIVVIANARVRDAIAKQEKPITH